LVPKITDFGLARFLDRDSTQTRPGEIMGTANYMAPEQTRGPQQAAVPADVYALGAILYEVLAGRPPFSGDSLFNLLEDVRSRDPDPPSAILRATHPHERRKVPRDLEVICLKCLEKEPGRRYASAAALADDLRRYRRQEPIL